MALLYTVVGGLLYQKFFSRMLLRCLNDSEKQVIIEQAHSRICGGHVNIQMLTMKITRIGYFWPTIEQDCLKFVRRCISYQIYGDKIHAPSSSLHSLTSLWPFSMWAFDVVGPLRNTVGNTNQQAFVLTATEYFTKWTKAESFKEIKATTLCQFIMKNITRFGIPKVIVSYNGPIFISEELERLCCRYGITHHKSYPYYPQGNGQAEATNKTLKKIVEKTV